MSVIKNISHYPWVIETVRFLRLQKILKYAYFYVNRPRDGFFPLTIGGLEAKLYINKPEELRFLESIDKAEGEKKILERFIQELKAGDAFYDVGAHIGLYTIFLAKKVGNTGKVIAFEPDETVAFNLEKSIAYNKLENVVLIKKALGRESGQGNLYQGETIGNASLVKTYEKTLAHRLIEIVKADDLVQSEHLPIPTLVKIDIEGYEYSALLGLQKTLSQPDCKTLCCEVHPGILEEGASEADILQFITSLGFTNLDTRERALNSYHVIATKS
jgi:FkbM family methyltransferase